MWYSREKTRVKYSESYNLIHLVTAESFCMHFKIALSEESDRVSCFRSSFDVHSSFNEDSIPNWGFIKFAFVKDKKK